MASNTTSNVYVHVIEDVIKKVRDEFLNDSGPGEGVLAELQELWELKMMQAGAIFGPIDRSMKQKAGGPTTPNPVHDLNVPYEGTEEYETPTADMLFPPTPLQTPMQTPLLGVAQTPLPGVTQSPMPGSANTPLPGSDSNSLYNMPRTGTPITSNEYPSANNTVGTHEIQARNGTSSAYMQQPSPWLNQRPPLDVNIAYVEGREEGERGAPHHPKTQDFFMASSGKRKREDFPSQYRADGYIPQKDGAGDALKDDLTAFHGNAQQVLINGGSSFRSPQLDGQTPDPYHDALSTPNIYNYQGVVNEDYNIANTPMPDETQTATPAAVQNDIGGNSDDHDDESLNEDDDEDDLDDVDQGEDLSALHLVLAQFDKVTRTKNRWKCMLKDGIMHINDKDILFNKATGEFDF